MKKKIIIFIISIIIYSKQFGQIPSIDPNFFLFWSDEFSGSALNRTNWDPWVTKLTNDDASKNSWATDRSNNIAITGGELHLTARIENYLDVNYTVGVIQTPNLFNEGCYFECESRIPNSENAMAAFWLYNGGSRDFNTRFCNEYREIDIMEWFGGMNLSTNNLHFCEDGKISGNDFNYAIDNTYDSHIHGCFWDANTISTFLDDKFIREAKTVNDLHMPMRITLDEMIDLSRPIVNPSTFPLIYRVNYVRVYRLRQNCDVIINEIPNFSTYTYSLKKAIYMSNATTIPLGTTQSLRAVDEIELRDGFEAPNNTTLYLNTNVCY